MRKLAGLLAALALVLLVATPVLAQGRVIFTDPGRRLDESAVRAAARPLVNKGATVAVYIVDNGGRDDFIERMIDDGIARADGALLSNVVAIYVAVNDRYSDITFGDQWSDALAVNDNFNVIRQGQLNPGLSDGDYTRAYTTALGAINNAIENPPVPGGGVNVDLTPVMFGVGGLAAAGVGGAVAVNRRRAARARADAQQRHKDAREAVGAVIADLGLRFRATEEKAKFDKVSYAPDDVKRLQGLQQTANSQFVAVQGRFKEIGEGLERHEKPSNAQLDEASAAYTSLRDEAQGVSAALTALEDLRAKLDGQARQAREELDRAKKV
ncbi:MAG: hypothetical protein AB4911_07890 [Oscillochloridaceae bacterium umkhey_bin13]